MHNSDRNEKLQSNIVSFNLELCLCFEIKKHLLAEQSRVFDRMFQLNVEENHTGIIKMVDFEPKTMEDFIRYVHLGYLDNDGANSAGQLFVLADKYMIDKLKKECASILKKGINRENILDRLRTAFMCNAEELKNCLLEYSVNKSSEGNHKWMTETDEWFDFAYTDRTIARDIMKAINARTP